MIERSPIRALFHTLTERGLQQQNLRDEDTVEYITNLLTEYVEIENMLRAQDAFDMVRNTGESVPPDIRRDYYRHLGDITLFNLGLYPGHLTYGRHTISPDYYAEQGRRSYKIVASMDPSRPTAVFRKLSDQFEKCVGGLNWVKLYINDPFYRYVFREFGVT